MSCISLILLNERIPLKKLQEMWSDSNESNETLKIVIALFECLKVRDPSTAEHSIKMAHLTYRLAEQFDKKNAILYYAGSLTHDIGKVGMSDKILKGKKKLNLTERGYLRKHVMDGFQLLSDLGLPKIMLQIVRYHH